MNKIVIVYNPSNQVDNQANVLRGSSWNGAARNARATFRFAYHPGYRYDDISFRIIKGNKS